MSQGPHNERLQRAWQQSVSNSEFRWQHVPQRFAQVGGVTVATPLKPEPLGGRTYVMLRKSREHRPQIRLSCKLAHMASGLRAADGRMVTHSWGRTPRYSRLATAPRDPDRNRSRPAGE